MMFSCCRIADVAREAGPLGWQSGKAAGQGHANDDKRIWQSVRGVFGGRARRHAGRALFRNSRGEAVLMRTGLLLCVGVLGLAGGLGALWYAWEPALDPIAPPPSEGFDPDLVATGRNLALIGDCRTCHSPRNGAAYSGGVALETPFGTIHSTNITPDAETGIGRWSQAAFDRAMRRGVDREGRHLYPAFPYDHFSRLTDGDLQALYAYVMSLPPVRAEAPRNDLPF